MSQPELPNKDNYLSFCQNDDIKGLRTLFYWFNKDRFDLNAGLVTATGRKNTEVAQYLIESGANNLDDCLRIACENNLFSMAELLVKNGASVVVGLKHAKSSTIITMLYRHESGSDTIK
jgi:hypothetical protein